MILQTLEITSFGALVSLCLQFVPGLNVVLGPNEAGKSTVFKALRHLLLTPTKLNKKSFQSLIQPLIPLGGGDTIAAALSFLKDGQSYRLSKQWGATAQAELLLPDGVKCTDPAIVSENLKELLPVNEGTLRTVLLTAQSALAATLQQLEEEGETLHNLSDILRRSVLEADGISVSRFEEILEERYDRFLQHWDIARRRPDANRGVDNPWKKNVGALLEAYYAFQQAERHYEEVNGKETAFGHLADQLEKCTRQLAGKERDFKAIERAAEDARERRVMESELKNFELTLKQAQDSYETWSSLTPRKETLEKQLPELETAVQALEVERREAENYRKNKEQRERFERIRGKREIWRKAEAQLSDLQALPRSEMEELKRTAFEIERLETALSAGNLSLTLEARKQLTLSAGKDLDQAAETVLEKGKTLEIQASGRIELQHKDWSLEVVSGTGDYSALAKRYAEAQSRFGRLLEQYNVSSLGEAEAASKAYEKQKQEAETAKIIFEREIGQDRFEALEEANRSTVAAAVARDESRVVEELVQKRNQLQTVVEELEGCRKQMDSFTKEYRDRETLLARIVELAGKQKEKAEDISALAPLPEGYGDASSLIEYYEKLKREIEDLRSEKIRLQSDYRNAESSLPDESSEEAKLRLEDVRKNYEQRLKQAQVLVRVREAASALLAEMDEGVYEPFGAAFTRIMGSLSAGRYQNVPSGSSLPAGLVRGDGQSLPYNLLSEGTKDIFALALRLAMADFFLSKEKGFLILDDPLVDLDPERQRRAAQVLADFSSKHQLFVFTCHPSHAELLGKANIVELIRI